MKKACLGVLLLLFSNVCLAQSAAEQSEAQVIANLVAAGSDTSKPHDIDFFLFFPRRSQTRLPAADIEPLGYVVASIDEPPANQSQWQLHATRRMAPQLEAMTSATRTLEALAVRYGGDYDGWGTGVVE